MIMGVGFTGTQRGMTVQQEKAFCDYLYGLYDTYGRNEFHHGDCAGADAEAHDIALKIGFLIVIHPPLNSWKRARCVDAAIVKEPKPYLERNWDIVDETDMLIATPRGFEEELRSGTWATIRYALKRSKPITIIYPDGKIFHSFS